MGEEKDSDEKRQERKEIYTTKKRMHMETERDW